MSCRCRSCFELSSYPIPALHQHHPLLAVKPPDYKSIQRHPGNRRPNALCTHPLRQVFGLAYRAPELFFNCPHYTSAVDMWAAGCIFAELMLRRPWFGGRSELQTLNCIFDTIGWPTPQQWPGMMDLPDARAYLAGPSQRARSAPPPSLLACSVQRVPCGCIHRDCRVPQKGVLWMTALALAVAFVKSCCLRQ